MEVDLQSRTAVQRGERKGSAKTKKVAEKNAREKFLLRMKYFMEPIVSLNVFRLIGRCTVSADVETSVLSSRCNRSPRNLMLPSIL